MGYTHYWQQFRPFTDQEWSRILAEAKRIVAKAARGLYAGKEDAQSAAECHRDEHNFRVGFKEEYAWRTFANPEVAIPTAGAPIKLAGPQGEGPVEFGPNDIALNGTSEGDECYESFHLRKAPKASEGDEPGKGIFDCCKTEYRPYDPVVVSILHVARTIAPQAITVDSDGGPEAIKLMF